MSAGDDLTPDERARIAPYVTDPVGPVFALTHLPEAVKGALFARYSRSANSVRRILLDEFIPGGGAAAAGGPEVGAVHAVRALRHPVERPLEVRAAARHRC